MPDTQCTIYLLKVPRAKNFLFSEGRFFSYPRKIIIHKLYRCSYACVTNLSFSPPKKFINNLHLYNLIFIFLNQQSGNICCFFVSCAHTHPQAFSIFSFVWLIIRFYCTWVVKTIAMLNNDQLTDETEGKMTISILYIICSCMWYMCCITSFFPLVYIIYIYFFFLYILYMFKDFKVRRYITR